MNIIVRVPEEQIEGMEVTFIGTWKKFTREIDAQFADQIILGYTNLGKWKDIVRSNKFRTIHYKYTGQDRKVEEISFSEYVENHYITVKNLNELIPQLKKNPHWCIGWDNHLKEFYLGEWME